MSTSHFEVSCKLREDLTSSGMHFFEKEMSTDWNDQIEKCSPEVLRVRTISHWRYQNQTLRIVLSGSRSRRYVME